MNANLYYDCDGESWTILDFHSSITFSSERGLKQAINRKIGEWESETALWNRL